MTNRFTVYCHHRLGCCLLIGCLRFRVSITIICLLIVLCTTEKSIAQKLNKAGDVNTELSGKNPKPDGNKITLIEWEGIRKERLTEDYGISYLYFKGASYNENLLPVYSILIRLDDAPVSVEVLLENSRYETISAKEKEVIMNNDKRQIVPTNQEEKEFEIASEVKIFAKVVSERGQPYAHIDFVPLRKTEQGETYEKLVSFELKIQTGGKMKSMRNMSYAPSSVLASGKWYKLGITKDGVYRIGYSQLKNIGINPSAIQPQKIKIYSNAAGMLPVQNNLPKYDDLQENSIMVIGEEDGKFDDKDYILFFGQSQQLWKRSGTSFTHYKHWYSDTTFYFLTTDLGTGKRIGLQPNGSAFSATVTTYNDYALHESDVTNLLQSGKQWYGESFGVVNTYDFAFAFPNIDINTAIDIKAIVAGHSETNPSSFTMSVNGQMVANSVMPSVSGSYGDTYAREVIISATSVQTAPTVSINLTYNKGNSSALAWLDYIEVNARRNLVITGGQFQFRDAGSVGKGSVKFIVSNAISATQLWDVTDPINVKRQEVILSGSILEFIASQDSLHEYIAFDGSQYYNPIFSGEVPNQNLHALQLIDMVIIAPPLFLTQAKQLAEFHAVKDLLKVVVITPREIYNEFSSGAQDITAIKTFMKMLYDRAAGVTSKMPKHLLLFGDGSYDYKDRISGSANLVPSYQSDYSLSPTGSYVSDDYYGLLDDSEGDAVTDLVDIGIGRLPVKTVAEAQNVVNKILHYYKPSTMRPWRNWVTYIADDEDYNIHIADADRITNYVDDNYKNYNIDKIYLDAYKQQVGAGGERYPDVNTAISKRMEQGSLMITWIGHGGILGWAHERILDISTINAYTNIDNMPMFITATCQFSMFDDPQRTSAGELLFLNPSGGAIALLTTTRLVYSSPNIEIVKAFHDSVFKSFNGAVPTLGDLCRATKIKGPKNINTRNFTLLGDPAIRLAYPKHNVVTTYTPDTIRALGKVNVKGYIADENGQKLTGYNGTVYSTVFDKRDTITTLNNDGYFDSQDNPLNFTFISRKNAVFKGKATVTNGDFSFNFVVPKDISYSFGNGKISYYAENGVTDGNGYDTTFIIGGSDTTAPADNTGPRVELYMNDDKFVFGGITDEKPYIYARVFDENGINTVGTGIGHDIVAVLDGNTAQPLVLNDYYEADRDSYQKGTIKYRLLKLSAGRHKIDLKVWDTYNNSGLASVEFVVTQPGDFVLDHVLNYPNPFTTHTDFYFEHNQPGQHLDVYVDVFTISGKLVKSIGTYVNNDGFRAGPIKWDGRDNYGDLIGRGVYIYKLKVIAPTGQVADKYEKLVIF